MKRLARVLVLASLAAAPRGCSSPPRPFDWVAGDVDEAYRDSKVIVDATLARVEAEGDGTALTFEVDRVLRGSCPDAQIHVAWTEPQTPPPPGVFRSVELPYHEGGRYRLFYVRKTAGRLEGLKLATVDEIRAWISRVVPARIALLAGDDAARRADAARGLGIYGPEAAEAAPRLRELLSDPEPAVRKAARRALKAIEREAVATPSTQTP